MSAAVFARFAACAACLAWLLVWPVWGLAALPEGGINVMHGENAAPSFSDLFAKPVLALQLCERLVSPRLLGELMQHSMHERTESVWFLRSRLIAPGCPLPGDSDMAALAEKSKLDRGGIPALDMLDDVMQVTRARSENYRSFLLVPGALRLLFELCALGSRERGVIAIDITLEELKDAEPRLELWSKAQASPVPLAPEP